MNLQSTNQKQPLWTWLCCVSPWILLFLFVALAVHVRLGLGHWPRPMWEEYHSLAFSIHQFLIWCFLALSLFAAPPSWLIFLCFRRFRLSLPVHLTQVVAFGCGWLTISLLGKYDPTTFTAWFLD